MEPHTSRTDYRIYTCRIVDDATKPESTVSTDAVFTVTPDKLGAVKG